MNITGKAVWISRILMGLVFVVAGAVKVWEPMLFYWESVPLAQLIAGQDGWPLAAQLALLLGPAEVGLGLALLAGWRPRLIFPTAAVLMLFFLGFMLYAQRVGATASCGCFGALVDRSPGEAAAEDALMLGVLLWGWWGHRGAGSNPVRGRLVLGGVALALVVGGARFFPARERLEASDLQVGVRLTGLGAQGLDFDLMQGEYLVEFFSPTCGRCQSQVPKLNGWSAVGEFPPVVALTKFPYDSQVVGEFKRYFKPRYPIASISIMDFQRFTWHHGYPRLAYVRDGEVKAVWEYDELPSREALKRVVFGRAEARGDSSLR